MTLPQSLIARKIGKLSDNEMSAVDEKLSLSLGL